MSKKKIVYIVVLILFVVLVGIAIFNNIEIKDNNEANTVLEYVPEQEISDEQNRMTIVTLYFVNTFSILLKKLSTTFLLFFSSSL